MRIGRSLVLHWRYNWAMWHLRRGNPRPMQALHRKFIREMTAAMAPLAGIMRDVGAAVQAAMQTFAELAERLRPVEWEEDDGNDP